MLKDHTSHMWTQPATAAVPWGSGGAVSARDLWVADAAAEWSAQNTVVEHVLVVLHNVGKAVL